MAPNQNDSKVNNDDDKLRQEERDLFKKNILEIERYINENEKTQDSRKKPLKEKNEPKDDQK